jgi:nitroreductase
MDVTRAIEQRRAVKHFDPNHEMTPAEIDRLMEHAMLSPTAYNIQNWRFVLVRDPELRKEICAAAWNQAQVVNSSLLVVLCADTKSWEKDPARYWRNAPEAMREALLVAIHNYYSGKERVQRDEAMRSCGMAAQTIMLAAQDMGYDTCPMDGFDFDAVGRLINLPEDHVIAMFVVVGKAIEPAHPRGGAIAREEAVIQDRFA